MHALGGLNMKFKKSIGVVVTSTLFIIVTAFADDVTTETSNKPQERNYDEDLNLFTNYSLDAYKLFGANV